MFGKLLADVTSGRQRFNVLLLHLASNHSDVSNQELRHGNIGAVTKGPIRATDGEVVGDC